MELVPDADLDPERVSAVAKKLGVRL